MDLTDLGSLSQTFAAPLYKKKLEFFIIARGNLSKSLPVLTLKMCTLGIYR